MTPTRKRWKQRWSLCRKLRKQRTRPWRWKRRPVRRFWLLKLTRKRCKSKPRPSSRTRVWWNMKRCKNGMERCRSTCWVIRCPLSIWVKNDLRKMGMDHKRGPYRGHGAEYLPSLRLVEDHAEAPSGARRQRGETKDAGSDQAGLRRPDCGREKGSQVSIQQTIADL